eukprot:TRINITY_DN12150_c0_g1_i1.p1 TRINITY_DN12150_c0_g1~~TRINITY_DN12150_c0_g1_i1.p1  ORF type:complete len:108 (-),score=26.55 TRINITY_DN12150_c0_g1_i1:122-445(-)
MKYCNQSMKKLKKHKRERSIMYQDEIEDLRRMLAEMEVEKEAQLPTEVTGDEDALSEAERIQQGKEEADKAEDEEAILVQRLKEEAERVQQEKLSDEADSERHQAEN